MTRLHSAARLAIVRVIARLLILGSIALLPSMPASGQATQASISGVVTDTSNAVLPGVTVAATGPALQRQVVAVSNEGGEYRLSPLPPGTYTITFDLPGFQSVKREGVRLAVGFTATIDQSMSLGSVGRVCRRSGRSRGPATGPCSRRASRFCRPGRAARTRAVSFQPSACRAWGAFYK